jgi:hypothetical protein
MRIKYSFATLPPKEQQLANIMLDVELEIQHWFSVVFSSTLQEEFIVTIQ